MRQGSTALAVGAGAKVPDAYSGHPIYSILYRIYEITRIRVYNLCAGGGCLDIFLSSIISLFFLPVFGIRPDIG